MKTDKIPSSLSVEELYELLSKKYDGVKKIGSKGLRLNYSNTKIFINKGSDGYIVTVVSIALRVLAGVIFGITFLLTDGMGLIIQSLICALTFAIAIYLVDTLYTNQKKTLLEEFCNSLNEEITQQLNNNDEKSEVAPDTEERN